MLLIFVGPPGAGKGTQAQMLRDRKGFIHINMGDILRNIGSKTGELADSIRPIMQSGQLVPDDLTLQLIKQELIPFTASCNLILDGFPRTVDQANGLLEILNSMRLTDYKLINIDADRDNVTARLIGRGRSDDTEEVIKTRLSIYDNTTFPVVKLFSDMDKAIYVDSSGDKESTYENLLKAMAQYEEV